MKKEYQDYITLIIILVQMGCGFLDVISDIDYAVNAKKSSEEIKMAAIFFIVFQPFCQIISWTYVLIKIHMMESQLDESEMKRLCYFKNRINSAETFGQFIIFTLGYKVSQFWTVLKLFRYFPQGFVYGIIQYFRMLHVYLFFQYKKNNQISQQYENIFTKRFKKIVTKLEHKIYSSLRKEAIPSSAQHKQKGSIIPLNSLNFNIKEHDIENSQTSSLIFQDDKPQLLKSQTQKEKNISINKVEGLLKNEQHNHNINELQILKFKKQHFIFKKQNNDGIINMAEAQQEKKNLEQLQEEFSQEELYSIYRKTTFVQFLNNEKIAGMIQISEIIEFIFESMPQLLIQFINNGQLNLWSDNKSGTLIPPIVNFIFSLISIVLNSIHLVNYLLQKESLNFVYIQKILSKKEKKPYEENLISIKDKLSSNVTIITIDSLEKVSNLRKEFQDNLESITIILPNLKQASNMLFMDISNISFANVLILKIDAQQIISSQKLIQKYLLQIPKIFIFQS